MSFQLSSYTSYLLKLKINSVHAESPMAKTFDNLCLRDFSYGRPLFASQTKKLRKRMCTAVNLAGWSVFTPPISCTRFKIHSAHADSPKTFKSSSPFFSKDQPLLNTSRNLAREYARWKKTSLWVSSYTSSLVQSSRSIQHMQTVPWPKHLNLLHHLLVRTTLCFTDQETQ